MIINDDEIKEVNIFKQELKQVTNCERCNVLAVISLLESILKSSLYSLFKVEENALTPKSLPIAALNFSKNHIPKSLTKVEETLAMVKINIKGINNSLGETIPIKLAKFFTRGTLHIVSGLVTIESKGISDAKEKTSPKPLIIMKRKTRISCFFLFFDR